MPRDEWVAEVEGPAEVEALDAYRACERRLIRTTQALVLAEAQTECWKGRYVTAMARAEELEAEVFRLGGREKSDGPELPDATD